MLLGFARYSKYCVLLDMCFPTKHISKTNINSAWLSDILLYVSAARREQTFIHARRIHFLGYRWNSGSTLHCLDRVSLCCAHEPNCLSDSLVRQRISGTDSLRCQNSDFASLGHDLAIFGTLLHIATHCHSLPMLSKAVHEYAIGCIGQGITESVVQAYTVRPHNLGLLTTPRAPSQNMKTHENTVSTCFNMIQPLSSRLGMLGTLEHVFHVFFHRKTWK